MTFKDFCNDMGLRLVDKIDVSGFIDYKESEGNEGKNVPKIKYHVFGDYKNNRLYLKMAFNDKEYWGCINSGVAIPSMIDRFFGLDQLDAGYINILSDVMCLVYLENKTLDEAIEYKEKNKR